MSKNQLLIVSSAKWTKRFRVGDYVNNPALIDRLFEEKELAISHAKELHKRLNSSEAEVKRLQLENQSLQHSLRDASRGSFVLLILSLVSIIFVGLGVNVVTNTPDDWKGWLLILGGCIIEICAFIVKPHRRQ